MSFFVSVCDHMHSKVSVCVYVRVYVCVCVCGMRKNYIISVGMLEGGCKCVCMREIEIEREREEKVSASKIFQSVCGNHVCRHLFKSQFAFLIKRWFFNFQSVKSYINFFSRNWCFATVSQSVLLSQTLLSQCNLNRKALGHA